MVNPLIDWKTNLLVLRNGNKLEVVTGLFSKTAQCRIQDRGLSGLQHTFNSLKEKSTDSSDDHRWGRQLAKLSSPDFWESTTSKNEWAGMKDHAEDLSLFLRVKGHLQGEVQ